MPERGGVADNGMETQQPGPCPGTQSQGTRPQTTTGESWSRRPQYLCRRLTGGGWRNRIVDSGVVNASELTANPANARKHPTSQRAALKGVLNEVGWVARVIVNRTTGLIVDGHLRVEEAAARGETVPVDWVELSEPEEALILAMFDPIGALAETDQAMLDALLGQIESTDADVLALIDSLATPNEPDATPPDADEVPPVPDIAYVQRGEVWTIDTGDGRVHRVMCGDSREPADMDVLIGTSRINLAFTSPPYAEQREYDEASGFRPIKPDEYVEWFAPIAANVKQRLTPDGSWFVNIKSTSTPDGDSTELYVLDLVIAHARQWGWNFATEFCWERNGVPKTPTRRFKNQFEPVYHFALGRWKFTPDAVRHKSDNVPRAAGPGVGDTNWGGGQGSGASIFGAAKKRTNGTKEAMADVQGVNHGPGEYIGPGLAYPGNRLPTFAGSHEALGHSAAFPVGLPQFFVKAYTGPMDIVFDPFLGSGSTVVAAHLENRVGMGMELSPKYCDVILRRLQQATGVMPRRESDGEVHDFTATSPTP